MLSLDLLALYAIPNLVESLLIVIILTLLYNLKHKVQPNM